MSAIAHNESAPSPQPRYVWRNHQRKTSSTFSVGNERERVVALSRSIAVAAIEVLHGTRPAQQLARWSTPEIVEKMRRRAELIQHRRAMEPAEAPIHATHRHSEVLRQRVCKVATGVYEVALVIRDDCRSRAVVVRVEQPERAWRITVLEIG